MTFSLASPCKRCAFVCFCATSVQCARTMLAARAYPSSPNNNLIVSGIAVSKGQLGGFEWSALLLHRTAAVTVWGPSLQPACQNRASCLPAFHPSHRNVRPITSASASSRWIAALVVGTSPFLGGSSKRPCHLPCKTASYHTANICASVFLGCNPPPCSVAERSPPVRWPEHPPELLCPNTRINSLNATRRPCSSAL